MATRRRNISFEFDTDTNVGKFSIYTRPDADGKQGVAETIRVVADAIHENLIDRLSLLGLATLVRQNINGMDDNPEASALKTTFEKVLAAVSDGSYEFGRSYEEREPTDLELAIAEVTHQPVADVQARFENDVHKNEDGSPKLDARQRKMRVWTEREQRKLARDPQVAPVLAKIVAERAKRLAAEAKSSGAATTGMLDMLSAPAPVAAAAQ